MTRTPMVIFAIHLDMASEMKEPEKPKNAANTSRPPRLLPCTASQASRPSRRATTDSTDRKSTRLNSSHLVISYAVFCLKKKKEQKHSFDVQLHQYHHRHAPPVETPRLPALHRSRPLSYALHFAKRQLYASSPLASPYD